MPPHADLTVSFVPCASADFTALSAALDADLEERYPGLGEDGPAPVSDLIAAVAYVDGAPVGCGALRELEPGAAELKRMYVAPEARGLGVARATLAALEEKAAELGYGAVRLGTGVRQPEAISLYESSGYRRVALFGDYEGAELCVCFEKALG